MAKVLNPFFAGEARGSVGAFTASRNRSGAYMRQKTSPVQPRTALQTQVRYDLQNINQNFQSLTVGQITSWNDFASSNPQTDSFGNSINWTGLNWYVALNSRLLYNFTSGVTVPPATANASYSPDMAMSFVSGTGIQLTYSPAPVGAQTIWVRYSDNVPLSRNFLSKDVRQRQVISPADTSPVTVVAVADMVLDTTQRQLQTFAVDNKGRATPTLRFTVQGTTP